MGREPVGGGESQWEVERAGGRGREPVGGGQRGYENGTFGESKELDLKSI